MSKIIIVGLGPAEDGLLTVSALKALREAKLLILKTSRHPITSFLEKERITFDTLDYIYKESKDFEEENKRICESLISLASEHKEISFGVPGHPLVGEPTTFKLVEKCKDLDVALEIIPGLSLLDSLCSKLMVDPLEGVQIVDALAISKQFVSPDVNLIVTRVSSKYAARDVRLQLLHYYPSNWPVTIVESAGVASDTSLTSLPLAELDQYEEFNELTSFYLPSSQITHT